jgi:hypothetical protein
MDTTLLAVLPAFLRTIAGIGAPFAGAAAPAIAAAIGYAATLIERGEAGAAGLQSLTDEIAAMGTANATDAEWAALKARSDAAHAILQAVPSP